MNIKAFCIKMKSKKRILLLLLFFDFVMINIKAFAIYTLIKIYITSSKTAPKIMIL